MNATFEKWVVGSGILNDDTSARLAARLGWQAAITSLEVTPDLLDVFADAFNDVFDGWNGPAFEHALIAVFAKLKDSANG